MKDFELNCQAMTALTQGTFDKAQELFYRNARKNPGKQTYNNLGMYLIEHGMKTRSNKTICARSIGEKYVKKAYGYGEDALLFQNLGRIQYEKGSYEEASGFLASAYRLNPNDSTLYNFGCSLFAQKKYCEVYALFREVSPENAGAVSLCFFSKAFCDRQGMIECLLTREGNSQLCKMDLPDQMLLFYLCEQYGRITDLKDRLLSEWSLREEEWAVLTDACVRTGKLEMIRQMIREVFADCETQRDKRMYKTVAGFLNDPKMRKEYITTLFSRLCFPLTVSCGYYGCPSHDTLW